MAEYHISDKAGQQLNKIWSYVRRESDSEFIADRFIDGFFGVFRNLAEFPDIAQTRSYLPSGLLAFPHEKYMIFFRKQAKDIEIAYIVHGSINMPGYFEESE